MSTKWVLAALVCGITVSAVPAAPAKPKDAPIRVEFRGRLSVTSPHRVPADKDDPIFHLCFPPFREYALDVHGQRFNLNIGRFGTQADKLNGQLVIVTGTLDLDTVTVTDLKQPLDEALTQYARVTIEGDLILIPRDFPPYGVNTWCISSGKVNFTLAFADPRVEANAAKLVGKKVVLTGTLKHGLVQVEKVS